VAANLGDKVGGAVADPARSSACGRQWRAMPMVAEGARETREEGGKGERARDEQEARRLWSVGAPASTRRLEKRRGKGRRGDGGRRALWTRRGEMQEIECVERG